MALRCNTPILWSSSLLSVQSRPDAFKAIILEKFKVTSEHVLITGHCPLM